MVDYMTIRLYDHDEYVVATHEAIDLLERLRQQIDPMRFCAESTLYRAALHLAESIRSCTSFGY